MATNVALKSFTKNNIQKIREDIDTALKPVQQKHGIEIKLGTISYSEEDFSTRLTAHVQGAESREAKAYQKLQSIYDLPDLHSKITLNGEKYKILGWNPRAKKMPVIVEKEGTSQKFKLSLEQCKRAAAA